ncbi:hypothetical protein NZD89_10025 [Alicyclobacillus fastidiosus]|uniref:Uncharacterized protein n=1 Tax=Alicyclobacillus fastidiosus TaxID=392011 RepID=A0ABY6ZM63_9BACL|nr:hypothetical protein [Alicyclobacillus fastidiosus]WAH43683.1 hypothetical protein NZD89_10025 [Alicyclobacillus fastidiosus]
MSNIRALAMQHVGRPVIVHSTYGVHRGILHHVDNNGMYLQMYGANRTVSASQEASAQTLGSLKGAGVEAEEVFWPLFFIPFVAAFALSAWYWYW